MSIQNYALIAVFPFAVRVAVGVPLGGLLSAFFVVMVPLLIYQGIVTDIDGLDAWLLWGLLLSDLPFLFGIVKGVLK